MKLVNHFDNFLIDTVNLNQTRIDTLQDRIKAIEFFVRNSNYEPRIRRFSAQGSWAHKTIIKPLSGRKFDADLVMFIDGMTGWAAKDYIDSLYRVFRDNGTYKDKVGRNTRCITINYAGEFHIDIVPCVVRESALLIGDDEYQVCNRLTDEFEVTDPEEYTNWLSKRNDWVGNNQLRKVVRLCKYLRDIKTRFSVKSILLTTLLGNRVGFFESIWSSEEFVDTPTVLKTLLGRLDDYLQANIEMPVVENPILSGEDFNRHWDQTKYDNFREKIHQYRGWVDDAYDEKGRDESIRKWRRLFGEQFASNVSLESNRAVPTDGLSGGYARDIVEDVRRDGAAILPEHVCADLQHVVPPSWRMRNRVAVRVYAKRCTRRYGGQVGNIRSGEVLKKTCSICFEARQQSGLPFDEHSYRVKWRVVNTGQAAFDANALRGGFESSHSPGMRWEDTEYHGAHWVEAFLISKRDGTCHGKSERFFVVVD